MDINHSCPCKTPGDVHSPSIHRSQDVYFKDLLLVLTLPLSLALTSMFYLSRPLITLIAWYYFLAYFYRTGTALESTYRIQEPILVLLLHLLVIGSQLLVLKSDVCGMVTSYVFKGLRRLGISGVNSNSSHGHHHQFTFGYMDYLMFALYNLGIWIRTYYSEKIYFQDPLKRNTRFYRSSSFSMIMSLLPYMFFSKLSVGSLVSNGYLLVWLALFYTTLNRVYVKNYDKNRDENWYNNTQVYTLRDYKDLKSFEKQNSVKDIKKIYFYNILRVIINTVVNFHIYLTSACAHQIVYKNMIYSLYQEVLELASVSALALKYHNYSFRNVMRAIISMPIPKVLGFLSMGSLLHVIEHVIPVITRLNVPLDVLFTIAILSVDLNRLVLTENKIYL